MAFALPLLGAGAGAGAAAGGTALIGAGAASTLATLGTVASVATGVLGTISFIQEASFAEDQANANAPVMEENAERAVQEAGIRAQRADLEAIEELGALATKQSVSGLSGGTYALQRKRLRELAARDRGTIIFEGQAESDRIKQGAADQRTRANSARSAGRFAGISGAFNVGSSLISGASKVNELKRKEFVANGNR